MSTTKSHGAQDFFVAADTDVCRFPGCVRPVSHDETSRYCRWCQEAFADTGIIDREMAELLAGSREVSVSCGGCGQSGTCALTRRGWKCEDCERL
ncbi:hypothetical protein [Williamsia sp. D3]|uniref:hypothetical protein n=1 Tax=Williamsia TaxID=85043 RepID=UPI0012686AF5|nr:hypothetical protein [Williamsia sp. D3]